MGNQQTNSEQNGKAAKRDIREGQLSKADAQVRENEDASLQDNSYTFDSDNTDSDEGIDDFDLEDIGLRDSDDYT